MPNYSREKSKQMDNNLKYNNMKASTWIKKNSDCPIVTEQAIHLYKRSLALFQQSSDSERKIYIIQVKDRLKKSDLYADCYVIAAKAFLKYISK
jgi:hypothetical protein